MNANGLAGHCVQACAKKGSLQSAERVMRATMHAPQRFASADAATFVIGDGSGTDKHLPERIRERDYAARTPRAMSRFPKLKPPTRRLFAD